MSVELFDSLDDMFEAEDKAREAADKKVTDSQKELKKGDYFIKDSGYGFPIFGQVLKEYKNKRLAHYRLCECYSVCHMVSVGMSTCLLSGRRLTKSCSISSGKKDGRCDLDHKNPFSAKSVKIFQEYMYSERHNQYNFVFHYIFLAYSMNLLSGNMNIRAKPRLTACQSCRQDNSRFRP